MQRVWVMVVALAFFGLGCDQWSVEAAERMVTCRPTENLATLFALRAALEHVQGGGA